MTAFSKLMKFDKIFENIRFRIQAVSSKYKYWSVLINLQKNKAHIKDVQRCILVRIDKKIVKMWTSLKL